MLEPRRSLLVVTGTDTGVGKTHVSRAILRVLARSDSPAFPLKLIETGCLRHDGVLVPDDGLALARAAGREEALPDVAPFRFELPAAPATAARHAGTTLPFSALVAAVERAHGHAPRVLLEGAGGLLVPLGPEGTFADLCVRLRPRVLLVARDALGTLNHTLLTAEALARRGLVLAAVVLNATGPEPCTLDHARELAEHLPGVPIVGPLPWQPGATDDQLANALAHAGLDPTRLAATLFADRG